MNQKTKLQAAIRANPGDVRFAIACKVAVMLGFSAKGQVGSHCAFSRPGEPTLLNFQDRGGKIPPYQGRQLVAMIDKYGQDVG